MAKAACSDAQFIALWKDLQSPTLVAKRLGIAVGNVHQRRARLENKHGLQLPVHDARPTYNKPLIEANRAVVHLPVSDGVVIVGSDAHIWPGPLSTMQRGFLRFCKRLKPYAIIWN